MWENGVVVNDSPAALACCAQVRLANQDLDSGFRGDLSVRTFIPDHIGYWIYRKNRPRCRSCQLELLSIH